MNINLLTFDNMFAGTTSAAAVSSRPDTMSNTSQFSPARDEKPPNVNTHKTTKINNSPVDTREEFVYEPPRDFSQTLRKKTTPEPYDSTKPEERSKNSKAAEQANIVQTWISEYSEAVEKSKDGAATKIKAKAGLQLAQLLANLKTQKSPPVTGQAAKSAEIKLLITTDKGQLGLKTVLPNTSKGVSVANTQLEESKKADKIYVINKTIAGTKALTNKENTTKLIKPEVLVNNGGKTTSTGKRPVIADSSTIDNTSKTALLSTKKSMSETLVDGKSKTTSSSNKTPAINTNLPAAQLKNSQSNSQSAKISPEKYTLTAEKQINNKDTAPQMLSESSKGNAKESLHAANNIPTGPAIQKLNETKAQISTSQTKSRSNSTSNNSTNSAFEQIFSQNNPQTPITVQSHTSAENAKATNLTGQTSPNDVSADIGKQILESIHKSFSQQGENRQITVRLNPPELGKVLIKFQERDAQLTGLLEVSKTQTRLEIEQALPQIIRNLTNSGIQIKRLEVVLSNEEQSEQGAFKDQSLQNGSSQQQGSTNPGSPENNIDTSQSNEWLTNNNDYQNNSELQEALITDGSINLLM